MEKFSKVIEARKDIQITFSCEKYRIHVEYGVTALSYALIEIKRYRVLHE